MAQSNEINLGENDVPALQKGLRLLEVLAERDGLTATEIERETGLNKAMVFRLLRALRLNGYVELNESTRGHSLGARLIELGAAATARLDVVAVSRSIIDELRNSVQETVNLGILRDGQVVYAAMAESHRSLRMISSVGRRDTLHSTSIGKSMLAWLSLVERHALLAMHPLEARTLETITDVDRLDSDLELSRQRGFTVDNQENEPGAVCIGVPILNGTGSPVAGLSVSGPSTRMGDDRFTVIADQLWTASKLISQRLGYADHRGE